MRNRGRSVSLPGEVPRVESGITKMRLMGWQKPDEPESDEAATDEPWTQAGGNAQ